MLYEMNNKIYIYASNKYYEVEFKDGSLKPTTKYVLTLKDAVRVTTEEAKNKLSHSTREIDREDNEIKLTRRYKDR